MLPGDANFHLPVEHSGGFACPADKPGNAYFIWFCAYAPSRFGGERLAQSKSSYRNAAPAGGVDFHGRAVEKYPEAQIVGEPLTPFGRLGGAPALLAVAGGRPNTPVEEAEVYSLLRQHDATEKTMRHESMRYESPQR